MKDEDLYDGKAVRFVPFIQHIRSQIANLGLSELEVIRLLRVSCSSEVRKLITTYECSLYSNPQNTLNSI